MVSRCGTCIGDIHMHAPATTNLKFDLSNIWLLQATCLHYLIKAPAPSSAPIANDEVSGVAEVKAAIAPNMSGAPFPNATNVMPAIFSLSFKNAAKYSTAGTK